MGTTYADQFAANLRAARARAGIAQKTVSARMKRLGFDSWDDTKVSRAERGAVPVVVGELLGLADSLGCTIRDLVGEASPDAKIYYPEPALFVTGIHVRNSGYGWNDSAVNWTDDEGQQLPLVMSPASPAAAWQFDKTKPGPYIPHPADSFPHKAPDRFADPSWTWPPNDRAFRDAVRREANMMESTREARSA